MRQCYTNIILWVCPVVMLSIAGCSSNVIKDENSPFYSVPEGSTLLLNQSLTIEGEQVATYVQDGKVMAESEVDKFRPNCKFELYTISELQRTVTADSFEIIKVVDEIETSSLKRQTQLAVLDGFSVAGMLDRSYMFNYATMMYLHSESQKDVYRMTCQHWEDVMHNRYLSILQMRQAMGEVFTLQIKE
ncbi:MAG: hypothetical protein RQ982_03780 [Gammaproteobacteria bacterium]|nr:hypothetical protein [Gammaproteobacteria bacterium]